MFDGIMPPLARPGRAPIASGVQMLPSVAGLALPTAGAAVGVLQGRFAGRDPVCLTLGCAQAGINPLGEWPGAGAFQAGLVNQAGAPFGGPTSLRIACALEYGAGSSSNKVFCDWQPGSYNLPPCEFVRVAALPWGTTWAGAVLNTFAAVASVAEGELQGAHVPTLSALGSLSAGVEQRFVVPNNARAFDVYNSDWTTTPLITVKGAATGTRNYASGAFVGAVPLPIWQPGDVVRVVSDVNTLATLRWFLAL